ncbi:hypothetical protein JHK85_015652 [Glycine max]|nr:transcription factor MYB1R1 [Glycine max]KAG5031670.1 hypothetical protein JHK85_015652 [Glycine max]KHN25815.1 Transcription factor MYB1R1 [Glycine soja]
MVAEIIDLSDSPPSSPWSSHNDAARILNFDSVSNEKNQFEKVIPISLMACTNPNQPQTSLWRAASRHTNEHSQIATTFQPSMQLQRVATVLEPVPESITCMFPHGARLKEPWTHREHELFLMGLIKYGKGHWSKIARHFLLNKTPQQVQSYGASFFRNLPSTHLHGFRRRKPSYSTSSLMSKNNNLMAASASTTSYFMPMIVNEPQQTHMFFPENAPLNFLLAPSHGEASSSNNNTTMYGFQMQTSGARTSMNASANGEVDLELRLG